MQRITFPEFVIHFTYEQAISFHHNQWIARLHTQHNIVITFVPGYAQEFHSAFHHSHRRVAITTHDAITQRTMISADTHGGAILFADLYQWCEPIPDTLNLS